MHLCRLLIPQFSVLTEYVSKGGGGGGGGVPYLLLESQDWSEEVELKNLLRLMMY